VRQRLAGREFFDLRNIFNCIDTDEDGYISMTDINIMFKRHLTLDLTKLDKMLLLNRFDKKDQD